MTVDERSVPVLLNGEHVETLSTGLGAGWLRRGCNWHRDHYAVG